MSIDSLHRYFSALARVSTVAATELHIKNATVYHNPTNAEIYRLAVKIAKAAKPNDRYMANPIKFPVIRFLSEDENIWIWEFREADHGDIIDQLTYEDDSKIAYGVIYAPKDRRDAKMYIEGYYRFSTSVIGKRILKDFRFVFKTF